MEFRSYQHIERYGNDAVDGILCGKCTIMPKIDGTNSSVWLGEDGELHFGSHHRELSLENDNAGFMRDCINTLKDKLSAFFEEFPKYRIYGEWLVPHSLKTYRDNAWRKFYIFDVTDETSTEINSEGETKRRYIPYKEYKPLLEKYGLEYIPPIAEITNPTEEKLYELLEKNDYLIKDGNGTGEGIIIKNYDFYNKYGRNIFAKIVTSEFKEKHKKAMGVSEYAMTSIEEKITDDFVTHALCEKEFEKIKVEEGWDDRKIPQLLNTVFHEIICEEMWNILKKYKGCTINFKTLQQFVFNKVKKELPELF